MSAFLSVLLFFSSFSVKASTITLPPFPDVVEGYSSTHYLIVHNSEYNYYKLIMPKEPEENEYFVNYEGEGVMRFSGPSMVYYYYYENSSNWTSGDKIIGGQIISILNNDDDYIVASSFNIYNTDGTIFFHKAPIKANLSQQMREVEMGATMTTVVYLIPLLIPLLVCLIGFRKAWAWLSKVLRKA